MTEYVPKKKLWWFIFHVNEKPLRRKDRVSENVIWSFFLILLVLKQSELVFVGDGDKQDQVEDIEDKEQQ